MPPSSPSFPAPPVEEGIPEPVSEPVFSEGIDAENGAATPVAPLPHGSWLAVLGGGQLGMMFCQAAQRLGYRVAAVDPDPDAPIAAIADKLWTTPYQDDATLHAMSELAQAATVEFENVPYAALAYLSAHLPMRPAADSVAIA